jgi:hypothetical protein
MAGPASTPELRVARAGVRLGTQAATLPLTVISAIQLWKAALIALLLLLVLLIFGALMQATESSSTGDLAYPQDTQIPKVFWPMYSTAAAHYHVNPYLLASIHKQESGFSGDGNGVDAGVNFAHCCAGPMQFNLSNTWEAYKNAFQPIKTARPNRYPNDRRTLPSCGGVPDNEGCVYDSFDAISGAAMKLSADGADESLESKGTHAAVCAYIGDCAEVDNCIAGSANVYCQVLPRARKWEQMGARTLAPDFASSVSETPPRSPARVGAVASAISVQTRRNQLPYCWGGGHGPKPGPTQSLTSPFYCWEGNVQIFGSKRIGLDCSGSVRWLLTQSGFPDPGGISSGAYGRYLEPGRGRHVTIYYGAGHIYAVIDGRVWQTSSSNQSHGPGWTGPGSAGAYVGVGHPEGL